MRKVLKYVGIALAMPAFVCAVLAVTFLLIMSPMCGEEVMSEQISPDGKYTAVLMERNCGATTPFVYHLNLRCTSEQFSHSFLGGTVDKGAVHTIARDGFRFSWTAKDELLIDGLPQPGSRRAFNEIRIKYSLEDRK